MPSDPSWNNTLIPDDGSDASAGESSRARSLPPDLLSEAVRRLRAVALVYAVSYFVAGALPALLIAEARSVFFSTPSHWLPVTLSIAAALLVVALASRPALSDRAKLRIGLGFEVIGSIGIAAAEYQHILSPIRYSVPGPGNFGLSWVAPWVLLFSVAVPTRPRLALLTALLSVAAVPLAYAAGVARGVNAPLESAQFFLALVFPYSVILLMAYVGARVGYGLGSEVRKAREMGSYRLVERLGKGAMGEVWRAQHRMLVRATAFPPMSGLGWTWRLPGVTGSARRRWR